MHYEVFIEYYAFTLFHKAISVSNAASIRDEATLRIEPLSGVVLRMQSHCDAYNAGTALCFTFCAIK